MKTLNDYLNDQLKNPEFAKAYEEAKPEIDAIRNSKGKENTLTPEQIKNLEEDGRFEDIELEKYRLAMEVYYND